MLLMVATDVAADIPPDQVLHTLGRSLPAVLEVDLIALGDESGEIFVGVRAHQVPEVPRLELLRERSRGSDDEPDDQRVVEVSSHGTRRRAATGSSLRGTVSVTRFPFRVTVRVFVTV